MTNTTSCNCMHECSGECPAGIHCPFDDDITLEKDRSKSRRRHHQMLKSRKKSLAAAKFLWSKFNNISENAPREEIKKAGQRAFQAQKIAAKYN